MTDLKHMVLGALLGLSLAGCGGTEFEDVDVDIDPEAYSGPRIDDSNIHLTVADIAGVWDITHDVEGVEGTSGAVNEQYLVITEAGDFIEYDYRGDSLSERHGNYANCFHKVNAGKIVKKAEGGFKVSFSEAEQIFTFSFNTNYGLQDGFLIAPVSAMDTDCKCATPIVFAPPASLTPDDMESILCGD